MKSAGPSCFQPVIIWLDRSVSPEEMEAELPSGLSCGKSVCVSMEAAVQSVSVSMDVAVGTVSVGKLQRKQCLLQCGCCSRNRATVSIDVAVGKLQRKQCQRGCCSGHPHPSAVAAVSPLTCVCVWFKAKLFDAFLMNPYTCRFLP